MKTLSLSQTVSLSAVETLKTGLSRDRHDRHAFIVAQVATVIALALCKTPPKGYGNPADWKALPDVFTGVGLKAYAAHCAAFPVFFKEKQGQRSVPSWADAQEIATGAAVAAFMGCAPRVLTAEEQAEKDAKKAAKKAEKAEAEKAQAAEQRAQIKAERQQAYEEGRASVIVTAQAVADMVTSKIFSDADIEVIGKALMARMQPRTATIEAIAA